MGIPARSRARLSGCLSIAWTGASLALALLAALPAAAHARAPHEKAPGSLPPLFASSGESGYYSRHRTRSASVVVGVPAIDCSAVASGTVAGQSYGITITDAAGGPGPWAAVVVRTLCEGPNPSYDVHFILPQNTSPGVLSESFSPGDLMVRPGMRLRLRATLTPGSSRLSARALGSKRVVSARGPGFDDSAAIFRASNLTAAPTGGVVESGVLTRAEADTFLPGPVPATPALFSNPRIDGRPLARAPQLGGLAWVKGSSKRPLAAPTAISRVGRKDVFAVLIAAPRRARTG